MSEEGKSKGISLRKKKSTRPKISAPKQIIPQESNTSAPTVPSVPSVPGLQPPQWNDGASRKSSETQASVRGRPSMGGPDRTADLVKRRYSTRFVNLPSEAGLAPPVPSVPQIPGQYGLGISSSRSPSRDGQGRSPDRGGQKVKVDVKALRDSNLQPEQYVAHLLADATENDIYNYQTELQKLKNHTSTDLQHNVYQNRTQFIKISKEADKLKTEMRTLRTLMSELTGALSHATSAGGSESTSNSVDQKRRNRTSVANLEALWSTHLQTLWKRVEGSQKFLPAIPGRHIVHESSRWVELNAATWKPRRRVHLILLNDHFLVASEKKRMELPAMGNSPNAKRQSIYQAPAQTQLVAERCWPLNDVQMTDISSRSGSALGHRDGGRDNIANGINVRVGTESWTFATTSSSADSSNEKAALLVALRKAVEDLRKNQAAQNGERERALDELAFLTGRDPKLLQAGSGGVEGAGNVNDAGIPNRSSTLIDVDGRQQSLRWVESQIDALDIGIALQHFEEAVSRTEKLRKLAKGIKGNAVAQEVVLAKLNDRASKLAVTLGRRLGEGSQGLDRTKESVGWLVRLGYEEMARVSYLEARRETLRKRVRQLPFTGSLPPHLLALSYVTFTIILHTIRTFTSSFPAASSSAVVKWAKERVDEFNESLERQMSSVEQGSPLWDECAGVVRSQSEVLQEVGVDFGGLVASGLFEERQEEMVQEARPRERREGSRRLQADGQREKQREPVGLGLS